MARSIDIHVRLDANTFRRFCGFDAFRRQRRWYPPVMVGMVLITLSIALLVLGRSVRAAGVLMGLGIAVPVVIFGLYIIQVETQVSRQKLKTCPAVYSLTLSADGARVRNDQKQEDPVDIPWDKLWAAFRDENSIYLYVNPIRAFILPDGQASCSPDALWQYLKQNMGDAKCIEVKPNGK